jgi:hypothetical protein
MSRHDVKVGSIYGFIVGFFCYFVNLTVQLPRLFEASEVFCEEVIIDVNESKLFWGTLK